MEEDTSELEKLLSEEVAEEELDDDSYDCD